MLPTPKQCKIYAAECRTLAEVAASPEHNSILLNLAAAWDNLAKEMSLQPQKKSDTG